MSSRIVVLSDEIANKIAAGEVVERPASIVKELIENSMDAGADDIKVELLGGGCEAIKVTDNGCGISPEEVALVFERHATSKIRDFEDIFNVVTFGFRGEAMPSIASVAHVELLTRCKEDVSGTKVRLEAGNLKDITPVGCPQGTQVMVTRLFAHVPARQKFLKTQATEQAACLDVVMRLALAHPAIRFHVVANGRDVFTAFQTDDIMQRVAVVMGRDFSEHCLTVQNRNDQAELMGVISRPEWTRANSKNIFLFVNRRFVRDSNLTHAVLSAYRQIIEPRRYPAAVLFLDLPPRDVDVNVHPAKLEVRFRDVRAIYDLVSKTVTQGLAGKVAAEGSFVYRLPPRPKEFFPRYGRSKEQDVPMSPGMFAEKNTQQAIDHDLMKRSSVAEDQPHYVSAALESAQPVTFSNLKYIGQFAKTYLVFEGDTGLVLMDQHAAHERIMLEKLKKTMESHSGSQSLLLPEVVHLTPGEYGLFEKAMDCIREIGLDVEAFGHDTVVVRSVPAILTSLSVKDMIADIAQQLSEQNPSPSIEDRKNKILTSLACRAAVKANHVLSQEEVRALCRELEETPFPLTCPHGRPVMVSFSFTEIERLFKRK